MSISVFILKESVSHNDSDPFPLNLCWYANPLDIFHANLAYLKFMFGDITQQLAIFWSVGAAFI